MKSRDGLALAILTFLSHDAPLTLAQYVTIITISVNDNPLCTPASNIGLSGDSGGAGGAGIAPGLGASGSNGGGGESPGLGVGSGASNGSAATNGGAQIAPILTTTGRFDALGYYAAPANGSLLSGPIITSPSMSVELCGASCPGYTYLALENGNECNCGTSLPKGTLFSSPSSLSDRRTIGADCTPCAGNGAECCGAPGAYALLYRFTPYVVGSAGVAYSSMTSVGSVGALSTGYSPNPSPSLVAYTSTGSDGLLAVGSTTSSYTTITPTSTHVHSTNHGGGGRPKPHSGLGGPSIFSSSKPGSRPSITGSATSSVTTIQGSSIIPGASSPGVDGGASTTAAVVHFSASAATFNEGNGGASSTAVGSNGAIEGTPGSGTGATTFNHGATPAINAGGGPEPTVTKRPSCVESSSYAGNNTKYSDFFGYTYDIRCNLDLRSTPTDSDAHADSFEDCLEYCSLLTNCIAVTYQDPPDSPKDVSNCFPKWSFGGYEASSAAGLYSGVNVNGASPGTLEIQNLCTTDNEQDASYDGLTYYDDFGTAWTIGCDTTLAIPNAVALFATITDTLASCVDYCSTYESCDMVNWTGPHTNGTLNQPNCFPASAIGEAGAAGSTPGAGFATVYS